LLAQAGLGSRREMEELIAAGQTTINGKVATIGDRAGPEDIVRVGKRVIHLKSPERLPRVMLYHKPEGEIVSRDDPQGRPSVFEKLPQMRSSKWIAIGRLDYNTSGLLIFTTDGELANRLMHPRFEVEREYAVRIMGRLTPEVTELLTTGVELEDGLAKFEYLSDQGGEGSNHWYRVILKEGRNREVRRMFEKVGMTVSRLMRVRFGPINLPPRLKRGKWIELDEVEIKRLLELVAMSQ
jgi:pseudouridine synthase